MIYEDRSLRPDLLRCQLEGWMDRDGGLCGNGISYHDVAPLESVDDVSVPSARAVHGRTNDMVPG